MEVKCKACNGKGTLVVGDTIADRVAYHMGSMGRAQLVKATGMSYTSVARVLDPKFSSTMSIKNLQKICDALDINLTDIIV